MTQAGNIGRVLGSLVLLGCGWDRADKSSVGIFYEGAGPYPAIEEARYEEALSHAQADADTRCCERLGLSLSGSGGWVLLPVPARASGARFQAAAAAACVAETARQECGLAKDAFTAPEACAHAYAHGRRKRGERCFVAWECADADAPDSYTSCSASLGVEGVWHEGVCHEVRLAKEGEDCSPADLPDRAECDWPLICDLEQNVCVQRPGLGEACLTGPVWGDTCGQGAVCDRKQSKRCVSPRAIGEPCRELEECENLACVDGTCRDPLLTPAVCAR